MISIQKLATVGVAVGILAASALPVLADDNIKQEKKNTYVKNDILADSNSGGNKIKSWGDDVKNAKIKTGDATTIVEVLNKVNSNKLTAPCECIDGDITQKNKDTKVKNYVDAFSNTGDNSIKASDDVKNAKIKTGDAYTGVSVSNYVNKNKIVLTP